MARIDLPHVQRMKDRHGKVRHYFRKPGCDRVTLPGAPGSREFMDAYSRAEKASRNIGERKGPGLVIRNLMAAYYTCDEYRALGPTSKGNYRRQLDRWADRLSASGVAYGDMPVTGLKAEHVRAILQALADTPCETSNLLKRLRAVFRNAMGLGLVKEDPTLGVKFKKPKTAGFRAWTDDDIALFKAHWAPGTRERLALVALLYSGQRRSDVVKMGRQLIRNGEVRLSQKKKGPDGEELPLVIPLHPELEAEAALLPAAQLMFFMTAYGKPMTEKGFSKWFSDAARKAGLPANSSPHGLRKAAARWLAEAGCSTLEIAAITGHASLAELERYTKSARQAQLARSAMQRLREQMGNS